MRYDVHTHAFHPKIAAKAIEQLRRHYGDDSVGNGLADDLLDRARRGGLDRVVIHSAATAPAQVIPANNWALSLQKEYEEVIAFGTIHPGFEAWEDELDKLRARDIRGLKLHPEFQGFRMDDPRLLPILENATRDFIVLFHVGDHLPPEQNPSCPYKMAALMDALPKARFIAAHLGGYWQWEHALKAVIGRPVYIDTSSTLPFISDELLFEIFRRHPREFILFGSDYPLEDPGEAVQDLQVRLNLSDSELETCLTNASELFE